MKSRCFKLNQFKGLYSQIRFLTNRESFCSKSTRFPRLSSACIISPVSRNMCHKAKKENEVTAELKLPSITVFSALIDNSETERKIKIILMEHALSRMSGGHVPVRLSLADMDELLQCKTACERIDLFDLFYIQETRKEFLNLKNQIEGHSQWEKNRAFLLNSYEASDHIRYGYDYNCLHIYHDQEYIRPFYNHRLAQAAKFGHPLVFEFGYEQFMTKRDCLTTAYSIQEAFTENRKNTEPFDFHFSSYVTTPPEHILVAEVNKLVKHISGEHSMITISEKKYSDLFPNKEFVYLTPHAEEDLEFFDHNVVYVIGASLDVKPLPFNRAKQDCVRTFRIPVERFQKFVAYPHKAQRFITYMRILLEMKKSYTWRDALKPPRDKKNELEEKITKGANLTDKRFKFIMKNYW